MSCLVKKKSACPPETTVSSLLASGSLNSGHESLNIHSSVQYKDKLYSSASQALEAYIKDFNLSLSSPDVRPGKIDIPQRASKNFRSSRDSFKSKCENVKQRTHLGRRIAYESDMVSLTTDDLLAFPADGSLSFKTSRPLAQRSNVNRRSWTASASCSHHQTSSFSNKGKEDSLEKSLFPSSYQEASRRKCAQYKFHKHDPVLPGDDQPTSQETVFHKNYPRWLTSYKTDLSISELSSIPESRYPIWLKNHKLLLDSSNENSTQTSHLEDELLSLRDNKDLMKFQNLNRLSTSEYPRRNDVVSLKHKCDIQTNCQNDSPSAYFLPRGLREHKDLLIDDTELVIQKARRALESSAGKSTSLLKNDGSPCTVDVLEAERLWDNVPIGLKPPVPVSCVEENSPPNSKTSIVNNFLEDCLQNSQQESTFSGGNHHGPVEALKLMLFNLQAVQHSFNKSRSDRPDEESKKDSNKPLITSKYIQISEIQKEVSREDEDFKLIDYEMIPVARSLQRALHHLSRLKGLVEDSSDREESKELLKT